MSEGSTQPVARSLIRRDGGTQPRAGLDPAVVAAYAEAKTAGASFPPLVVFFDGADYWLADGFHRDAADGAIGLGESLCDVRAGTRRDAVLFAVGANAAHGLPRTQGDKRRAVLILLGDAEWGAWSDREIARRAHVSHTLVATLRAEAGALTGNIASERVYATRHGTVSVMQPAVAAGARAQMALARQARDPVAEAERAAARATIMAHPQALYDVLEQQRAAKNAATKLKRIAIEQRLGGNIGQANAALVAAGGTQKTYGVIYADPEWRYEPRSRETGMDRAPENHYPTTPTSEICKRPVAALAARDCTLFLWATIPMLPDAFHVMEAWGFTYRSHTIWGKRRTGAMRGPGYWFTAEHEVLLLGTRGAPPCPAPGLQWPSLFIAPVGRHSEKPDRAYELIESYFPNLPKIELNARARRPGWDCWGAEVMDADWSDVAPLGRPMAGEWDDAPSSWLGLSRPSTSSLVEPCDQDVDARHKGEHDGEGATCVR